MKISCNEGILTALSSHGSFIKEGRLNYRKERKKYFKERWFKLRANLLFYYKTNDFGIICEDEPKGCLVLVRYTVQAEFVSNASFAFSLTFHGSDDKHFFSGQSLENCQEWIDALQRADLDVLRQHLLYLKRELRLTNPRVNASSEAASNMYKKANKPLNVIPKRYEKKIYDDSSKRDLRGQPTSIWHIPKAKSSSALEQVRKSYSLASLMLDPNNCNAGDSSAPTNKSKFFVDKKKFFIDITPNDCFCQSLDEFPSKKINSTGSELPHWYSTSATHFPCQSTELPQEGMSGSSDTGLYHSNSYSALLRNKKHARPNSTVRHSQIFDSEEFHCKDSYSNQLGIVLQPLALISDPFVNTYAKTSQQQKTLNRQGCSFVEQETETFGSHDQSSDFKGIYRRPRSCTLAQLESIPAHLLDSSLLPRISLNADGGEVPNLSYRASLTGEGLVPTSVSNMPGARNTDRSGFQNWEKFDE